MADEFVTGMRGLLSVSDTEVSTSTSSNGTDSVQENEETATDANVKDTEESFFEIIIAHGKGFGLFATKDIPRGTRIIGEKPLLAVPGQKGDDLDLSDLETTLRALDREQYDKIFELHRGNKATSALAKALLSQQSQALSGAFRDEDILDAVAIFTVTSVEMGPGGHYGVGIFEHYSRINHACNGNVQCSYNPLLKKLTVHTTRQINKGDEILTSYIDGTCRTREERRNVLDHWGFECGCECCVGSKAAASERRRSKMSTLKQRLAVYAKKPASQVPRSPRAALRLCEDILELYRFEDITDYNLALLYRDCSDCCLQSGLFDKAVNYAKKERNVERYCLGTDISPFVKGADIQLKHVLSMREKDAAQRKATEKLRKEEMTLEMEMAQPKKKGGKGKKKNRKGKKKGGKGKKKGGRGKKKGGKGKKRRAEREGRSDC